MNLIEQVKQQEKLTDTMLNMVIYLVMLKQKEHIKLMYQV